MPTLFVRTVSKIEVNLYENNLIDPVNYILTFIKHRPYLNKEIYFKELHGAELCLEAWLKTHEIERINLDKDERIELLEALKYLKNEMTPQEKRRLFPRDRSVEKKEEKEVVLDKFQLLTPRITFIYDPDYDSDSAAEIRKELDENQKEFDWGKHLFIAKKVDDK